MLIRVIAIIALCLGVSTTQANFAIFQVASGSPQIPTPDTRCVIAGTVNGLSAGNCSGAGAGTGLFTAATCNGVADDVAAFSSFNTWAVGTWQVAHPGLLMELDVQSGKTCSFISGDVNHNKISQGLLKFQFVGYGATLSDNNPSGGGFALGAGNASAIQFKGTDVTARVATVSAGSSCVTLLDATKISLWSANDKTSITGIDPQGFGDPPNPMIYEWPKVGSVDAVHQCDGVTAGASVHFSAPLAHTYKSTWPLYNPGRPGLNSDDGGPGTLYQLGSQSWASSHSYYGLAFDAQAAQINAVAQTVYFQDVSCSRDFCVIPSENESFTVVNGNFSNSHIEIDKIVSNYSLTNVSVIELKFQQPTPNFSCSHCTITNLNGTAGVTQITNSQIASMNLGATSYGPSGSFTADSNTTISGFALTGASAFGAANGFAESRGVWSGGTFTVPANVHLNSYSQSPTSPPQIRLNVSSTAGWTNGIKIDACGGTYAVTVVDATNLDLQGSTYSAGICAGETGEGNLPLTWAVPGANVYLSNGISIPEGPILQVADLSVGPNGETIVSFNVNGSPLTGGFPVTPGTTNWKIADHSAPSWSCVGCQGVTAVTDANSAGAAGLPYGSYMSRVVTAANSSISNFMNVIGQLTELDMIVSSPCSGASNFNINGPFINIIGSTSVPTWNPTVNAQTASATPRKVFPTTTSGAQAGDSLATPGTGAWMVTGQVSGAYSNVGNCGSASATMTFQTNQGVVYP